MRSARGSRAEVLFYDMSLFDRIKTLANASPPPVLPHGFAQNPAKDGVDHSFIPFLVSWNITKRCNLRCAHCYLDAGELEGRGEATAEEARRFIDEIASLNPHSMLILTGGEPLMRPDCLGLSRYATVAGLTVVLGTNGTLLDGATVKSLIENGVKGVGVSLDSPAPAFHDGFRGLDGAWKRTVDGIDTLRRHGLDFQVQLTVTRGNIREIPAIIELAERSGARAVNVFFLVCTGRGQNMTDLTPEEYEGALEGLARAEKEYGGKIMVRARCAPHFLRVAERLNPESPALKGQTSGCIAATGYLRISPEGYVTPCPYMPFGPASPNLKRSSLKEIWDNDPVFKALRAPRYSGRCGECEHSELCGGCRARALAATNDVMGEDPWCKYEPSGKKTASPGVRPVWTPEAETRLSRVPLFLRPMVKKGVERYASAKGLSEITPEIMGELRKRAGR